MRCLLRLGILALVVLILLTALARRAAHLARPRR
jgi:hypothetical protein